MTIDELNIQITADAKNATDSVDLLTASLENLGKNLDRLSALKNKYISTSQTFTSTANNNTQSNIKNDKALQKVMDKTAQNIRNLQALSNGIKSVTSVFVEWFNKSNDYIETLNLFNVTMGSGAKSAKAYADSVSNALGIDISDWLNYQGRFKQLTSGFGVVEDKSNIMSKNLTQLAYDMASFFNSDVDTAYDKLSSAISGQVKGLRQYGIDTTIASLQEYALTKGIDKKVSSMMQAEKALIRYNYIMEKSVNMQGDMARTISTPANSMRILNAQLEQGRRALGNIASVVATQAIPYFQAALELLKEGADWLANYFGFELPEIDYSGLSSNFADADEEATALSKTVKEIKRQLMGFDEINILKNDTDPNNSIEDALGDLDLKPYEYDFLKGLDNKNLRKYKEQLKDMFKYASGIAAVLGSAKIAFGFSNLLKEVGGLKNLLSSIHSKYLTKGLGLTLMITGLSIEALGGYDLGLNGNSVGGWLKTAIGASLAIGGSLLFLGTGPVGWTVGIGLAITTFVVSFSIGYSKRKMREDLESRFGDVILSQNEIQQLVNKFTGSEVAIKLGLYIEENKVLDDLKSQVESAIQKLNLYNFKIQCGIEVTQEDYQSAVDNLVSSVQEYIDQNRTVMSLAVDIIYEGDTKERLSSFVNNYYSTSYLELDKLGKQLKETVSQGFVEGEWIPDKYQQALDLEKDIQDVINHISDIEFEAKIKALNLDAEFAMANGLSAESFQDLMKQSEDTIATQLENLKNARLKAITAAGLEYENNLDKMDDKLQAKSIYDAAIAEANRQYQQKKIELSNYTLDFGLSTIANKYSNEVRKSNEIFNKSINSLFRYDIPVGESISKYYNSESFGILEASLEQSIKDQVSGNISSAAQNNIDNLIQSLFPTVSEYEETAKYYRELGESVPKNVAEGLSDFYHLQAIKGNAEAINYIIGEKFSTDLSFLHMLETSSEAGKQINEYVKNGLANSVQFVKNEASNTIDVIRDGVVITTLQNGPILEDNLKSLGITLGTGFNTGVSTAITKDSLENPLKTAVDEADTSSSAKTLAQKFADDFWISFDAVNSKVWSGEWTFQMAKETVANGQTNGDIIDIIKLKAKQISPRANGGFVTQGDLFIANEAGPELVGRIGNQTAVANTQQIESGIASGVYSAVAQALKEGGSGNGNDNITVYVSFEGGSFDDAVVNAVARKSARSGGRV